MLGTVLVTVGNGSGQFSLSLLERVCPLTAKYRERPGVGVSNSVERVVALVVELRKNQGRKEEHKRHMRCKEVAYCQLLRWVTMNHDKGKRQDSWTWDFLRRVTWLAGPV